MKPKTYDYVQYVILVKLPPKLQKLETVWSFCARDFQICPETHKKLLKIMSPRLMAHSALVWVILVEIYQLIFFFKTIMFQDFEVNATI